MFNLFQTTPGVAPEEAQLEIGREGVICIDVRQPEEFAHGHIPHALCVPLESIEDISKTYSLADKIYVVCRTGRRSGLAVERLRARGFQAFNVKGGMLAWEEANLPVVSLERSS